MKYFYALMCLVLLVSCSETREYTQRMNMPAELSDCRMYDVASHDGNISITVMRCPNSTTTTQYKDGKYTEETILIDGVEYVNIDAEVKPDTLLVAGKRYVKK